MDSTNISLEKCYELFGVSRATSIEEIKTIYRQMAKKLHPDLNPQDPLARDRFLRLDRAYRLLLATFQSATVDNTDAPISSASSGNTANIRYSAEPPLSPEDLKLKTEIFQNLEKLFRQGDFLKAVPTIEMLAKVIPDRTEIAKKQSEVYFKYAQDLVKQRRQLDLARIYLKKSLKLDPHSQRHWEAVNREFNRIERLS